MRAPREMRIDVEMFIKVIKPIYSMPESRIHCFKTYTDYHKTQLGMNQSKIDPCVMFRQSKRILEEAVAIHVDDTNLTGPPEFLKMEEESSK